MIPFRLIQRSSLINIYLRPSKLTIPACFICIAIVSLCYYYEVRASIRPVPRYGQKASIGSSQDTDTTGPSINRAGSFKNAYVFTLDEKYDQAKLELQKTLKQDSSFFEARLLLGWILLEKKDVQAIEECKKCAVLRPDDLRTRYFLAYSLQRFGHRDEALHMYADIINADSTYTRALIQQAALYEAKGDSNTAEELIEKASFLVSTLDSLSLKPSMMEIPIPTPGLSLKDMYPPPPEDTPPSDYTWWEEVMPELTYYAIPEYPEKAKKAGLECIVFIQILVNEKGLPERVKISKPCGKAGFNEAAEEAAWKCRFKPGTQDDKPIRVWVSLPFRFELTGDSK